MTAVKVFKKSTPANEIMERRIAWLETDNDRYIAFRVYARDGVHKYLVTIRKSDFYTTCPCEDRTGNCWHMRKALMSYLSRIQRGEVK